MAKFKDNAGGEWEIPHFDPFLADDVQQATGVSLYTLTQKNLEPLRELFSNRAAFWNVIYILAGEQVKERGLTDRQFVKLVTGGDCLDGAQEAFWEEVLFFSQKSERELLAKAMAEAKAMQAKLLERANQEVTTGMQKLSGDWLDSPDSTPTA